MNKKCSKIDLFPTVKYFASTTKEKKREEKEIKVRIKEVFNKKINEIHRHVINI